MIPTPHSDDTKLPALYAALANAQGAFPPIKKNRAVTIKPREKPAYSFTFADLFGILQTVRPALATHGLGVMQPVVVDETGAPWLLTVITHAEGACLVSNCAAPQPTADPKEYGGLLTYMRRYMLCSMLCIATDDDLDENGQEGGLGREEEEAPRGYSNPPPPARRSASADKAVATSVDKAAAAAAAATPAPAGTADAGITAGQLKNLQVKLGALELDGDGVRTLLAKCGVPAIDAGMSLSDWQKVKRELDTAVRAL